jgi:hypothetical protein
MHLLCLAGLIVSLIGGCLFLRVQRVGYQGLIGLAVFCAGWVVLSYGVMIVGDLLKVPGYPVGNRDTAGNYVFVLLSVATNPNFWQFVCWSTPCILALGLLALNVRANRYAIYMVIPVFLIQAVLLMTLLSVGLSWFPSRYEPERIPYFNLLVLAKGSLPWIRPVLMGGAAALVLAAAVATAFALKRKLVWVHRPSQLLCAMTAALSLVGVFQHEVNQKTMLHLTPEACYYRVPEIEQHVRRHPDSFVNLIAEEAETEDLKMFILQNAPSVPRERFQKERRDDAK